MHLSVNQKIVIKKKNKTPTIFLIKSRLIPISCVFHPRSSPNAAAAALQYRCTLLSAEQYQCFKKPLIFSILLDCDCVVDFLTPFHPTPPRKNPLQMTKWLALFRHLNVYNCSHVIRQHMHRPDCEFSTDFQGCWSCCFFFFWRGGWGV